MSQECSIDRLVEATGELGEDREPCGVMIAWPKGEGRFTVKVIVGCEVMVHATAPDLDAAIVKAAEVAERLGVAEAQVEFAEACSW